MRDASLSYGKDIHIFKDRRTPRTISKSGHLAQPFLFCLITFFYDSPLQQTQHKNTWISCFFRSHFPIKSLCHVKLTVHKCVLFSFLCLLSQRPQLRTYRGKGKDISPPLQQTLLLFPQMATKMFISPYSKPRRVHSVVIHTHLQAALGVHWRPWASIP